MSGDLGKKLEEGFCRQCREMVREKESLGKEKGPFLGVAKY